MREGLMYLQTVVGAKYGKEVSLKIDLDDLEQEEAELVERAKIEVKMIVQEIKVSHG